MKLYAFFSLLLLLSAVAFAQNVPINGVVINAETGQPVAFATLGIKGQNAGTVANEGGKFSFNINSTLFNANENLIVTAVGYQQATIPVQAFKQGKQSINLQPYTQTLGAVHIKPRQYKTKVFGRTGSNTFMMANMFTDQNENNDDLGKEQASIIKIDQNCYLKNFNMLVVFNRFKALKFRLNFYNVKVGQPDQLIVNKEILFDVDQKKGWIKVDLVPYDIYLQGYKEIAVGVQFVKSVRDDSVARSGFGISVVPVPFQAIYFRHKSQGNWTKISPARAAFNITADSYKLNKDEEEAAEVKEDTQLSDSLKRLLAYQTHKEEARASGYGRNSKVGKFINLPDAKLYYEEYGAGDPLLLLHGNSESIASFYQQIPVLAQKYRVIAVDTRAQGQSTDNSRGALTYDQFAEDMKTLLDSLHIKKANVLGWSDGGNTGLIMAAKYPAYIKKLVVAGAVLSPAGVEEGLLNTFRADLKNYGSQINTQTRLLTLLLNEPHITPTMLQQIQSPVLVTAGETDVVEPEHTRAIAGGIKNSKLLIIKGATHYAPQEKPAEFNEAVVKFFN